MNSLCLKTSKSTDEGTQKIQNIHIFKPNIYIYIKMEGIKQVAFSLVKNSLTNTPILFQMWVLLNQKTSQFWWLKKATK